MSCVVRGGLESDDAPRGAAQPGLMATVVASGRWEHIPRTTNRQPGVVRSRCEIGVRGVNVKSVPDSCQMDG